MRVYLFNEQHPKASELAMNLRDNDIILVIDDALRARQYQLADELAGLRIEECVWYDGTEVQLMANAKRQLGGPRAFKRMGSEAFLSLCAQTIIETLSEVGATT